FAWRPHFAACASVAAATREVFATDLALDRYVFPVHCSHELVDESPGIACVVLFHGSACDLGIAVVWIAKCDDDRRRAAVVCFLSGGDRPSEVSVLVCAACP